MKRPVLLDLFCGGGGASMGYWLAGFDVLGVDVEPMPHYPFDFIQADAIEFVRNCPLGDVAAIAASPPCKVHTALKAFSSPHHVDLVPDTREALIATGLPYVIENVVGAPLINPIMLCGSSFDLGVQRHRLFESNVPLQSLPCLHRRQAARSPGYPVYRSVGGERILDHVSPVVAVYGGGETGQTTDQQREAMGIDWLPRTRLSQAIPPAYTEFIGRQLFEHVLQVAS